MKWVYLVLGVVFGYIFSQILNSIFVYYFYIENKSEVTPWLFALTISFFLAVGLLSGLITGFISKRKKILAASIAAGLIVLVTIANIVLDIAAEPLSHKLTVIFILAPALIFGASWGRKTK